MDNTEVFLQDTVLPVTLENGRKYVFNTGGTATAFEKIQPHLLLEHPLPPRRMASGVLREKYGGGSPLKRRQRYEFRYCLQHGQAE